jgi:hypothetical protein
VGLNNIQEIEQNYKDFKKIIPKTLYLKVLNIFKSFENEFDLL